MRSSRGSSRRLANSEGKERLAARYFDRRLMEFLRPRKSSVESRKESYARKTAYDCQKKLKKHNVKRFPERASCHMSDG